MAWFYYVSKQLEMYALLLLKSENVEKHDQIQWKLNQLMFFRGHAPANLRMRWDCWCFTSNFLLKLVLRLTCNFASICSNTDKYVCMYVSSFIDKNMACENASIY